MLSDLQILRATGKGGRINAEVDEIQYTIEMVLDAQRWVRTGRLGSPFVKGTLKPAQRGF